MIDGHSFLDLLLTGIWSFLFVVCLFVCICQVFEKVASTGDNNRMPGSIISSEATNGAEYGCTKLAT